MAVVLNATDCQDWLLATLLLQWWYCISTECSVDSFVGLKDPTFVGLKLDMAQNPMHKPQIHKHNEQLA